ncbi:VWA domain-containing protein [Oryzihumus leptocrescens]|uniref:Mg-protoporphyrin IX chelatase n=1 Tax=Oryzihumus leptocrescens TaxID=297536 RepID=A0A542ZIP9_9MICO|nr:VWA domain-containing protein [Oryzihumus leptocrescens]TQL60179.1 magnesium chelatase subunit D [Oryzihumus leptocrescens]
MRPDAPAYPFTAVVGMDDLSLALCLSAVSPVIGGVLVRGEKGTAKSTMVRALAAVLPPVEVVQSCRFSCAPTVPDASCPDGPHFNAPVETRPVRLVELPVGASEDRVVGSLHLDRLLSAGETAYEPGLLAQAHRGILYVDEVNLLPDHLVDTLLDSAAMGRARVEREGVSVTHGARFVLVGTMNPEEGELRPQLLDRFGLAVEVAASRVAAVRVEVVRRHLAFERDPDAFAALHAQDELALSLRIAGAQERVAAVALPDAAVETIARICAAYDVDGMRGDLVTARTAIAHAAWCGRDEVSDEDVRVAARLALPHRRRRNPFDDTDGAAEDLERVLGEQAPGAPEGGPDGPDGDGRPEGDGPDDDGPDGGGGPGGGLPQPPTGGRDDTGTGESGDAPGSPAAQAGQPYAARLLTHQRPGPGVAGRRSRATTTHGRHLRGVPLDDPRGQGLSVTATVHAAARRTRGSATPLRLVRADLRRSQREGREGNLVVFAVDTSGSMGAAARVREVRTAVVSLLLDAYQRRDRVAVVTFAGDRARLVLPPTSSVELAQRRLAEVPTGGRTPLAEGLVEVAGLVRRQRARDPQRRPLLVLLTDGRATHGKQPLQRASAAAAHCAAQGISSVVVDCEKRSVVRLGLARELAATLRADYLDLGDVAADALSGVVRRSIAPPSRSIAPTTGAA